MRGINAADVATTDKEKRQKSDKIDARKLCEHLQSKKGKGIYVPSLHWEHCRSLVRGRAKIVSNQTRCKNRIWQLLHFNGLSLPKGYEAAQYWSNRFIKELQAIDCSTDELKTTLNLYIKDYQQTKSLIPKGNNSFEKYTGYWRN
ncbi:MAG: transposase [Parafilimonas sp.]